MFEITRVNRSQAEDIESLGSKPKFWFNHNSVRFLFKSDDRGTGEDWAEKIVCELAALIGVPRVQYELAQEYVDDQPTKPGVICPNFVPPHMSLIMGNQLLYVRNPAYPQSDIKYGVREHTVEAVAAILPSLKLPPIEWMEGTPPEITTSLGLFVGYVMLDAWVANQDRHHQNWGAVSHGNISYLAPSYDHGASLARNLNDEERRERLTSLDRNRTVGRFATRARSGFYHSSGHGRTMLSIDVFREFANRNPVEARAWLRRLESINVNDLEAIFQLVPDHRMSNITKQFTLRLLETNHQRLLCSL